LIEKILENPYEAAIEVEGIKENQRDELIRISNTPKVERKKEIVNSFSDAVWKLNGI
jgi:hypothetical protein